MSRKVRRIFVGTLSVGLDGVRSGKWNSDGVIFFSQLSCNAPKSLMIPKIFACAYCFDLNALIVRRLMKS